MNGVSSLPEVKDFMKYSHPDSLKFFALNDSLFENLNMEE